MDSSNVHFFQDCQKCEDINGQMVTLERTQPRQLSLFQTFLPDEERYSNTIDLYDALPKYFSNHTIMRSLRKSGQYLPVLKLCVGHIFLFRRVWVV